MGKVLPRSVGEMWPHCDGSEMSFHVRKQTYAIDLVPWLKSWFETHEPGAFDVHVTVTDKLALIDYRKLDNLPVIQVRFVHEPDKK